MSKVITFSRTFPAYHPRKGEPTYFVEKLLSSINYKYFDEQKQFSPRLSVDSFEPKHHTIRAGNRWKVGDKFSPRVWSGKPYQSKMITIAPDIEIKKVWDIKIQNFADGMWIDFGNYHLSQHMDLEQTILPLVARNDGLDMKDLIDWFKFPKHPFFGQIICWNENINY
jgi:hypothetical protein